MHDGFDLSYMHVPVHGLLFLLNVPLLGNKMD